MKQNEDDTRSLNTNQGRLWLSQFHESDQDIAKLLLEDLLYISNDQLIDGLYNTITSFAQSKKSDIIALFTARENTGERYWRNESKRPLSVSGRLPLGSEGIIAGLCRDISQSNSKILDHPSIQEMKKSKCRYILIVDDMIGSGTRMEGFVKWLYQNRTIKSWHSLGYINFISCSYAASNIGKNYVLQNKICSDVINYQSVGYGRSIWNNDQKNQIEDLCNRYGSYTSRPSIPLGYKGAFTAIVFTHKCPNTNPVILWSSKTKSWNAIFSARPEFILDHKCFNRTQKH